MKNLTFKIRGKTPIRRGPNQPTATACDRNLATYHQCIELIDRQGGEARFKDLMAYVRHDDLDPTKRQAASNRGGITHCVRLEWLEAIEDNS